MTVELVFPIPLNRSFSYLVPTEYEDDIELGKRVLAPFGKKMLTGFIVGINTPVNEEIRLKKVLDIIDKDAIFSEADYKFYKWISEYYYCPIGDVLRFTVPQGSNTQTKRVIFAIETVCNEILNSERVKSPIVKKILNHLLQHPKTPIKSLQKLAGKKNIYSLLKSLEKKGAISILEDLENAKVKEKRVKVLEFAIEPEEVYSIIPAIERKSTKGVEAVLKLISYKDKVVYLSEFLKDNEFSISTIKTLQKQGIVNIKEHVVTQFNRRFYTEAIKDITLTESQSDIVKKVRSSIEQGIFSTYLLHGVTGSGKTQVYIELIKVALSLNRTALILVPEISLTPQITSRLMNSFGEAVSVVHSKMNLRERYDSWLRILQGRSTVVIGARSALFSPLKNLGVIIVDEEHDQSYKQSDLDPKYNARDSAVVKGKIENCPVLLGSATPSLESMLNAQMGKYQLLDLTERVDGGRLPQIILVNTTEEAKRTNTNNPFSTFLLTKIEDRLKRKEGVILLQNRRGFSTNLYCLKCGYIERCVNCSVSLVYHIETNRLKCHYCGYSNSIMHECPNCKSSAIRHFGRGTERIEDELSYHFPNAQIGRLDSDSAASPGHIGKTLQRFKDGQVDILVGTQMVAKGLDFPRVTLVGVISAELTLWMPDFRADERTFQLLTQVAGRSGRATTTGEVVIQTQNPQHFVLQKVLLGDYMGFYSKELNDRKGHGYPPFTRICIIEMKDKDIKMAYTIARAVSYGMNITFCKRGYTFAGTLINNTNISGGIENMNVWYKAL